LCVHGDDNPAVKATPLIFSGGSRQFLRRRR
jgi:hypothetical protein